MNRRVDRRSALRLLGLTSLSLALGACAEPLSRAIEETMSTPEASVPAGEPLPEPTPAPDPPFVVPAGEERRLLMEGTPYETPLYVFASGRQGKSVLVVGGAHGNEPGGWLAAERVVDQVRPENGALLVVPRANKVAINLLERTTTALGDLNRSYPGFDDGLPMERMAADIVAVMREYRVEVFHDMHESWAFYRDRTTSGTAFLGQTISTNGDAGNALVKAIVERVNSTIRAPWEEFFFRDFGGPNSPRDPGANLPRQTTNIPPPGRGTSSLGLHRFLPDVVSLLVEMGQQQSLERRTALHVQVLQEVLNETGVART
jgi:hypothetical protein